MSTNYANHELNSARRFIRRLAGGSVVVMALAAAGFLQIFANSDATMAGTDQASVNLAFTAQVDLTGVLVEVLGEPYHLTH